jgi:hypothetical protein
MADEIATIRAVFEKAATGNDGLFAKEEFSSLLLDVGFTQEQVDAMWIGAKGQSAKVSYTMLLEWISRGSSRPSEGNASALCDYIRQRNLCELSDADISYLEENNISKVLDVLLSRMVKEKPLDTSRFCTELFSGVLARQKRLVLMASQCPDVDVLKEAVKPRGDMGAEIVTATWKWEENPESLTELVKSLVSTHGTFKTIALCCHGRSCDDISTTASNADGEVVDDFSKKWLLTQNHGVDVASSKADPGVDEAMQAIAEAASVRVDILACSLAATKEGRDWVTSWEKSTNTNFAASTNMTGNIEKGADWVLETDGIDVMKVYFNQEKLLKWQGTFAPAAKAKAKAKAEPKAKPKAKAEPKAKAGGGGGTTINVYMN